MNKKELYSEIYDEAYQYLLSFDKINEEIIEKQLNEWKIRYPDNIEGLYDGMLKSLINKGITDYMKDNFEEIGQILNGFDPRYVVEKYNNNWKELFEDFENEFGRNNKMNINKSRNNWVKYCKGMMDSAIFLTKFENKEDFDEKFIKPFLENDYTKLSLPLYLSKIILGYGLTLACDFLKENVTPIYIKPETHIMDIFKGIGLINDKDSELTCLIRGREFADKVNKVPYNIDKLFWLIGSGNFYLTYEDDEIPSEKDVFIKDIREKYGKEINSLNFD